MRWVAFVPAFCAFRHIPSVTMDAWTIFRRARVILFVFLVFLCLTLAALIAVFLAHEWSYFSAYQKIAVVCLLSLDGFTAILLYLMVVVQFRLWWDVARVVSLLVIHTGSSVVFTLYLPRFPCRGFDTEASCKDVVFSIFIGCWVLSGMILCFLFTLGFMAFLPRPVESLIEKGELPFSPASFKAGSLFNGERPPSFYSFSPRTGLSPYGATNGFPDESLSTAHTSVLVNRALQESPRLWQSSQTQRLGNSADGPMDTKTMITSTDSPVKLASVDVESGRRRASSLYLNLFSARSSSPPPTPASETGNEYPSVSLSMPGWPPTVPKSMYIARSATLHHDRATLYTPTIYTELGEHSIPATFRENHQPHHMYPDVVQTASPRVYSFHSATASIHSKWAVSPPHVLPPLALTPGVGLSTHFLHLQDPPSTYRAHKPSEPNNSVRDLARRSHTLAVTESSFQRRGSDGQVDYAQWRQLVLGAATKP